ncbi:MAG TPA: DinB family protein [Phnomibacter sp.]|nr:DinB family protein [Phnomibacter sp.]
MNTPHQLAKHLRDVIFGGNWTTVNLKDTLADVNWQQATTRVQDLNTIAMLVFHINYYFQPILKVLQGHPMDAHDKYSFDLPTITCEEDWQQVVNKAFTDTEVLAAEIEKLDEAKLDEPFADPKYGSYYRNLMGLIEHTHYHLGQIVVIRKLLAAQGDK